MKVVGLVSTHNEIDCLKVILPKYQKLGIELHVIDDWSTDGSEEYVRSLGIDYEKFPTQPGMFSWDKVLERKEQLATVFPGDWHLQVEADEILESPWPEMTLPEALAECSRVGFNVVNFQSLHFRPTAEDGPGNHEERMTHFEILGEDGGYIPHTLYLRAWSFKGRPELKQWGGHRVRFPGFNPCPQLFIVKHYPFRTEEQGNAKVLERQKRLDPENKKKGWDSLYFGFGKRRMLWKRKELYEYDYKKVCAWTETATPKIVIPWSYDR